MEKDLVKKCTKKSIIKEPIMSYGIILYHIDPGGNIWYLLGRRRDTIEYLEYLRGGLPCLDKYFELMTVSERERIMKYSFEELWNDAWLHVEIKYNNELKNAATQNYNNTIITAKDCIKRTFSNITEPLWCFPKGKKNNKESEITCAFREFIEETGIKIDYTNLKTFMPCTEIFKGSNNKLYGTIYYIAEAPYKLVPFKKIYTPKSIRTQTISEEMDKIEWYTYQQCLAILPIDRTIAIKNANAVIMQNNSCNF